MTTLTSYSKHHGHKLDTIVARGVSDFEDGVVLRIYDVPVRDGGTGWRQEIADAYWNGGNISASIGLSFDEARELAEFLIKNI